MQSAAEEIRLQRYDVLNRNAEIYRISSALRPLPI